MKFQTFPTMMICPECGFAYSGTYDYKTRKVILQHSPHAANCERADKTLSTNPIEIELEVERVV